MRVAPFIFAVLLLALGAAVVAGPELDRARRNTALARSALSAVEGRLTDAEAQAERIRIEMDRNRDLQRNNDRKLDRLTNLKRDLPGQIRDEESRVVKLKDELRAATEEVARLQMPLRLAIDQLKAALATVKEIRTKYLGQFEASDPYRLAIIAAEVAAKNLAAAHRAVLDRLRATANYKSASTQFAAARVKLDILKRDPSSEPADRAAAASMLISTESAVSRMESDALATDAALKESKADAQRQEAALKAVIDQFERDLPRQTDMADALAKHEAAQKAANLADAAMSRGEARLASANSELKLSTTRIAEFKIQQGQVDGDILAVTREQTALARDLDLLSRRLTDNVTVVNRLRREVELADRRYRDARDYEFVAARIDAQNEKNQQKDKK